MSKSIGDDPDMSGWCGTSRSMMMQSTQQQVKIYLVGGAVREIMRGFPEKIKDWDFAVEAKSFDQMRFWLKNNGFEIFVETPQYFTIRARAPKGYEFAGIDMTGKTFDFALCRTDGEYSDGRRPDSVEVGSLEEDLSRRDFTINAMALDSSGTLYDPHNGMADLEDEVIRCVGSTERLREDSLRMLRAIRFMIQLDFLLDRDIDDFLLTVGNEKLLANTDQNRIRDELTKCFKADTMETLSNLNRYYYLAKMCFKDGLWLKPTSEGK
jgi:tRNA nucleotidyltransferase (CCA-adding enzyme)